MKKIIVAFFFMLSGVAAVQAQKQTYADSLQDYQANYVGQHEVITGKDKSLLRFYPVNETYRVKARFQRIYEAAWFDMETSGKNKKTYRVYGILSFTLHDTLLQLRVYQSQSLMKTKEYSNSLFAPFTDKTSGEDSYENGRYVDMTIEDLANGGTYWLDFNKAYNPYCAYVSDVYNCPVPPPENDLPVAIKAGEMKYRKGH
jgi:uncharacterized protein